MDDPIARMKAAQREAWASFAPFEMLTAAVAPALVRFAGVTAGATVLDVGCGTGVVALTAARRGARASGLDLTPALLEVARENSALSGLDVAWREGDAEALPYDDASFDFVLSQFGHMFGPRPAVVTAEMLCVLKPGGVMAFSTWPPELFTGRMFALVGRYSPPPPAGSSPPTEWGDPATVRARLGDGVEAPVFDRDGIRFAALSPAHMRRFMEHNAGPVARAVAGMTNDPARLAAFRDEFDALIGEYFHDNIVRQDFLMTRARKRVA